MGVRLPPEYQEVEYIRTDGNQRIRTNVYSSGSVLETEAKLSYDNARLTAQRTILHAYSAGNSSLIFLASLNNETKYGLYTNASGWLNFGSITPYGTTKTVKTVVDIPEKKLLGFVDGQLSDEITFQNNITNSNNRLWVLTYVNPADTKTTAERFHGNIYYIKFTEDGVVKMHLIPCYRKSDNVIGLYDIVNNTFYTNNQGTGAFTKGADVVDSISPWLVARRRLLMQQEPELYPIGTDIVSVYASNWKNNYSYNNNGSNSYTSGISLCEDYFPINPKYTYRKNGYRLYTYCCWYNANKQFISSFSLNTTTAGDITNIPANACFMRITTQTNSKTSLKIIRIA